MKERERRRRRDERERREEEIREIGGWIDEESDRNHRFD